MVVVSVVKANVDCVTESAVGQGMLRIRIVIDVQLFFPRLHPVPNKIVERLGNKSVPSGAVGKAVAQSGRLGI
ncbi:MAG: hypothetical protein DMG32_07145 [Acidobacteria bacterium]|nr:MAG: hypothetical protein DMG32_07145 [Acidobacteriota bacterium]